MVIAVSKLFDGITDIFFGSMIDKTKSRMITIILWFMNVEEANRKLKENK